MISDSFILNKSSDLLIYKSVNFWILFSKSDIKSFEKSECFFKSSLPFLLIFLIDILVFSFSNFACLTNSFRLSSVRVGILIIKLSSFLTGFNPKLDDIISFWIKSKIDLSQGWILIVELSGVDILEAWDYGVWVP